MIKEAIVLAGGFGTRLKHLLDDRPKPMAPINGRPFLEILFDYLCLNSIERIILSTGYMSEYIEKYFGNSYKSATLIYSVEDEPLGTGGAIIKALRLSHEENILVTNGDTLFRVDLKDFELYHISKSSDITIALRDIADCRRYGTIIMDDNGRVSSFSEKREESVPGTINGGVYLIRKTVFDGRKLPYAFSLEKDLFSSHTGDLRIYGRVSDGYFIDIGTPDDYKKAEDELQ